MESDAVERSAVYDVDASDPQARLVDRAGMEPVDIEQITELMTAFGELRDAEQALSEASRRYMHLNATDMRALHYLIICRHRDVLGTPRGIADHLAITPAATTKLLDRLERGGHITRAPHPHDRRAQAISITLETYTSAMETVGRAQSQRFHAAARLSRDERETVIRFLRDTKDEITSAGESWTAEADDSAT
ncbi:MULTISPECIES: MarR family winged helix-turn-helix transcriptional regulator [Brevibacterium]|jgi:DNA-binding MarR family transcriptional regulator|uniref:MarR family transcriptional regulator n=1 Tax=Brevibacterium casei TaxID=33889 RepID=A0A7T4DL28_9MICO|nr:MarR family transcriptional regulator [Brevibacterium casei]QQB15469.1 MarR family transcriptional regulator [Brevibacterium casei]